MSKRPKSLGILDQVIEVDIQITDLQKSRKKLVEKMHKAIKEEYRANLPQEDPAGKRALQGSSA